MSALGDIQQIYVMLQQIDKLLSHIETETLPRLKTRTESTMKKFLQFQSLLYGTLGLLRRMGGGDENVMRIIAKTQQLISTLNMLRISIMALQAASGPLGWGLAVIGLAGTVLTMGDVVYDSTRGA